MKVRLLFSGCFAACSLLVGGSSQSLAQTEATEEAVITEVIRNEASSPAVQDEVIREVLVADPTSDSGVARIVERIMYQDEAFHAAGTGSDAETDPNDSLVYKVELKARMALHLQQQMQQLSVTMKSLGRQLESLEKLENSIRSEALPSKAKLHAAAEAFGQALREHLDSLKNDESLAQLPELIRELSINGNGVTSELLAHIVEGQELARRKVEGHELQGKIVQGHELQGQIAIDVADVARAAANAEAAAAIAEKANVLGLAELSHQERAKLFLERMTSDVESARALEEVVRSTAIADAIKAKLKSEADKQKTEATDNAAEKMEKLEARLNRIEELLEKLSSEK